MNPAVGEFDSYKVSQGCALLRLQPVDVYNDIFFAER